MKDAPLLKVQDVSKHFKIKSSFVDKYLFKKMNERIAEMETEGT